ncbi:D-isomer specific 2-hydroxyacid dehydrogenase, NAD binding domain [Streptomyces sp. 1331.2]|nr:D-isomer specific 2-hydroxyacid dehydrogenase, NAD binding domain [Streptomyces sp. 1331.2]
MTEVEILAYGVQADEQPLLEQAFAGRHSLRTLAVFLDRDTAPLAAGYPAVSSSSSVNAVLDAETLAVLAANRTREFDFRLDGLLGRDVHGMTVGVIGSGKIGECFARIAAGFGTELLGWNVSPNPACLALGTYTDLPELLTRADLVSLHVPLVPATHHLIDAAALARMKDDAILVNSSRGGLVDSVALVETLRAGLVPKS